MSTKDLAEPLVASEPKVPDTGPESGWPRMPPRWLMILIVIILLTLGWFFFPGKPRGEDMVNDDDEAGVGEETDESDDGYDDAI